MSTLCNNTAMTLQQHCNNSQVLRGTRKVTATHCNRCQHCATTLQQHCNNTAITHRCCAARAKLHLKRRSQHTRRWIYMRANSWPTRPPVTHTHTLTHTHIRTHTTYTHTLSHTLTTRELVADAAASNTNIHTHIHTLTNVYTHSHTLRVSLLLTRPPVTHMFSHIHTHFHSLTHINYTHAACGLVTDAAADNSHVHTH